MYTVVIGKKANDYFNVTLTSVDNNHYLNIYVYRLDGNIAVLVSKSEDGLFFKSPCEEANDLELNTTNSLEEAYEYMKNHFLDKGYKLGSFE